MFWFDFNWQIQHLLNQWWWPINALLLVLLVSIGYLSYKKPAYAAGLTIVLLPTYLFRSYVWFLPFTFLELCIWVTFSGWLLHGLRHHQLDLSVARSYRWPILLLLLASTVAIVISPDLRAAAGLWRAYFIEPVLFFIVISSLARSEKNKNILLWSLGISTLSISFLAIVQKFTGFGIAESAWIGPEHRRVTAMFTSPNAVGLYLGPIIALYAGWMIAEAKTISRTAWKLLVIILGLVAISFTVSHGTWLGLLAAGVTLGFLGWNKKYTAGAVALVLLLIVISPIRAAAWSVVSFQDAAGQNRLTLLSMSQQFLFSSPSHFIFGAGMLGFAQLQEALRDPLKIEPLLYPHNIVLNFWLELGLLGLVAFCWLVVKFFRAGTKPMQQSWLTMGLLAAMVTIVVHGMVDVPYFKNDLAVLFWVIIGLMPERNS